MSPRGPKPLGANTAGKGGYVFDQCPGFWKRTPAVWGDDLEHSAGNGRSAGSMAYDVKYELDKGTLALHDLPGKAHGAVLLLMGLEADKQRNEMERLEQQSAAKRGVHKL